MNDDNFPQWQAEIDASDITAPIEYKYVIYNPERKIVVSWENGPNRTIQRLDIKKGIYVKTDETFHYDIPNWKGSGVAIPIFFASYKRELWYWRIFRFEENGRLGICNRTKSNTNTSYQRYHTYTNQC